MAETLWDSLNNQKFLADRAYKDENGDNIVSTYAKKSEMSVTPGTGADADKTTIELKNGLSATVLTAHQSITGKADKAVPSAAGNFAALDANGNLTDSGKTDTDFATSAQGAKADSSVQSVVLNGGTELKDASGNVNIPLVTTSTDGVMSSADKGKLDNIEADAQVNVQADWDVTDTSSDAFIKNKPAIPVVNNAALSVKLGEDSPEVVFSANSDTAGMIEIPLAAYSDTEPAVYTDGLMTGEDKEILDQAVQVLDDAIMGVKVDGTLLTPDADNIVNIELSGKQDVLTAGTDLKIENNVISVNTNSQATGDKAFVAGEETKATGIGSFAIGYKTSATGNEAVAEGIETLAEGAYSHAEGESTKATTRAAHAEGSNTSATGDFSHAEGDTTLADGRAAHAEGAYTRAIWYAHAEGYNTSADQFYSHAGGQNSLADGNHSFVHGLGVSAASDSMVAVGSYNETTANAAFVVGNGTSNAHSDAFIVGTDGTASATVLATSGIPDVEAAIKAISVPDASDANPQMDGTAAAGSSDDYSRADHVHPSDTSKQDVLTFNTQYDPASNKAATMSDIATELAPYAQTTAVDQEFAETSAWANDTFYPLTSNPAGYLVQSDLGDYATTGDLTDLGDVLKADIDFVSAAVPASANNGTLTINIGTTGTATFMADQSTDTTATIPMASFTANPGTSTTAYTEGLMSGEDKEKLSQIAPGAQVNVQSDWTESDSASDAYIKNKPQELDIAAGEGIGITEANNKLTISVSADYATDNDINFLSGAIDDKVETTAFNDALEEINDTFEDIGEDINFLSGAITGIPAQVQSDWAEDDTTDPAYIKNKPNELSLSAGTGIGVSEDSGNIIISVTGDYADATTVNSDISFLSGAIGNKLDITAFNDTMSDLRDELDVVDYDIDYLSAAVSSIPAQVQADWSEDDITDPAYIKNKPNELSLSAGTGIGIVENADKITISVTGTYAQMPASHTASNIAVYGQDDTLVDNSVPLSSVQNVKSDWNETNSASYAYINNKPDVLIPQVGAGVTATPKYIMVVTAMPAATAIDPNTIYLVKETVS